MQESSNLAVPKIFHAGSVVPGCPLQSWSTLFTHFQLLDKASRILISVSEIECKGHHGQTVSWARAPVDGPGRILALTPLQEKFKSAVA